VGGGKGTFVRFMLPRNVRTGTTSIVLFTGMPSRNFVPKFKKVTVLNSDLGNQSSHMFDFEKKMNGG